MNSRENYLRAARFQGPEYIPANIALSAPMWNIYKRDLEKVVLKHPILFPNYVEGSVDFDSLPEIDLKNLQDMIVVDKWGCTWSYPICGLDGAVIGHPLEDIDDLDNFKPPVPEIPTLSEEEWKEEIKRVEAAKNRGELVCAGTEHGFLFLRHTYLRGFENAMIDYGTDEPRLHEIYDMIINYWMPVVEYNVKRGVDQFSFAEDLGTQEATILSPADFNKWVKPVYAKLMKPCKDAGILVYLHSDGKTLDILEDQIEAGVDIVNPQDLCNGIDNIAKRIKGKACIQIDIDRQFVIPYGTPKDIDDLIKEEVMKLGSKAGGLMMIAGVYPPTPMENLDALCTAVEKYREYWK